MGNDEEEVSAVSVKLPQFDETNPTVWFIIFEHHIKAHTKKTTSKALFIELVSSLTVTAAAKVINLITDPDKKEPYNVLKKALFNAYS